MSALYLLIGFSFLVAIGFLIAFLWAVKSGQFEDSYTPSVRMLFDDELKNKPGKPMPEKTNENNLKIK